MSEHELQSEACAAIDRLRAFHEARGDRDRVSVLDHIAHQLADVQAWPFDPTYEEASH